MKRTNVVLDEELLEEARRMAGERTYSGAINKALAEYVRVATVQQGIEALRAMGSAGLVPGYLKRIRPNVYGGGERVAAHEVRASRKKGTRRGPR